VNSERKDAAIATHADLLFSLLKQSVNVMVGNLAVLGGKYVVGAVTNHRQHLVFAELRVLINQPTCHTYTVIIQAVYKSTLTDFWDIQDIYIFLNSRRFFLHDKPHNIKMQVKLVMS